MTGHKRFISVLLLISTFASALDISTQNYHIVKPGEIFSRIARGHFGAPTYSENGALAKLMSLNPDIDNIDFLKPGQRLRLTEEFSRPVAAEVPIDQPSESIEDSIFKKYSQIIINPGFRFVRIDAVDKTTDADAIILSKSYLDFPLIWQQNWNPSISSYQRFSISFAQFDDPGTKTISNKSSMPLGFGIGVRFFNDKKHRLITELGYDQFLFTRATSATAIKLDTVAIPNIKLKSEHDLIHSGPFTFGGGLNLASYFSASHEEYNVKNGMGYGAGVYLSQKLKDSILGVKLNYEKINQDTSIIKQERSDLSASFIYTLKNLE